METRRSHLKVVERPARRRRGVAAEPIRPVAPGRRHLRLVWVNPNPVAGRAPVERFSELVPPA